MGRLEDDTTALRQFVNQLIRDRTARTDLYGYFETDPAPGQGYLHTSDQADGYTPRREPGIPDDRLLGCSQEADRSLSGLALPMEASKLPGGGPAAPVEDSRVKAAFERWSACMAEGGRRYARPLDALVDERWRTEETVSAEQLATIRADLSCKQETNLVSVAAAVQASYDRVYINANQDALDQLDYVP